MRWLIFILLLLAGGGDVPAQGLATKIGISPGPSAALFASPYYACNQNWYVGNWGQGLPSDSNNGTSKSTPWATIQKADTGISVTGSGSWCVNVANGTYTIGSSISHGGTTASNQGYVVYRCQSLGGCIITDAGGQTNNSAIAVNTNYVMVDGFTINGGNGTGINTIGIASCQDGVCGSSTTATTTPKHHIWALNNLIHGYGQAGIEFANGEFFYMVHNTVYDNSHDCQAAQGSGVSFYLPLAIPSYSLTADDQNNPVTGNTGTLFRQFITWNVFYNNYVGCTSPPVTDGNGIILDDWQGDQFATTKPYLNGGLVAFNIVYNNGAGGIHAFNSEYVTIANNSIFNNYIDAVSTNQGFRGNMDDDGSFALNFINNISYANCGSGILGLNSAVGVYGIDGGSNYVASTTLNAAIVTTLPTTISVASAAQFPGGATFVALPLTYNGSYALPGGNMIKIDSEVMTLTAGWTTTSWAVSRGSLGTTPATHAINATVQWIQNYFSNNVTAIVPPCGEIDQGGSAANGYYSATANKEATLPNWVNVGNTSFGSESASPIGSNFALQGGSAAIGYGMISAPFNFLSSQAVDAGACASTLVICP
jgi:hypothetical protein